MHIIMDHFDLYTLVEKFYREQRAKGYLNSVQATIDHLRQMAALRGNCKHSTQINCWFYQINVLSTL